MNARVEWVDVTPELALEWLTTTNIQRKVSLPTVSMYMQDMVAGRWSDDSTAICFNKAGELVNGQHRLTAVFECGCTIRFLVMFGVSDDAILRMDSGRPRTAADQMHIHGLKNANDVAAIIRPVLLYDAAPGIVWTGATAALSKSAISDYAMSHDEMLQPIVPQVATLRRAVPGFNKTAMGALAFLVRRDSQEVNRWDEFVQGLLTGAGLQVGDPRLAFRNFAMAPSKQSAWGAGQQSNLLAGLRAWNRFASDGEMRLLRTPRRLDLPMPKVV